MESPNAFTRADPRVLDDDPFWSHVRRRHPDVDVVLLPPTDRVSGELGDLDGLDEVRRVLGDVAALWRGVVRPLLPEPGVAAPPSIRWRRGDDGAAVVVQKALLGLPQEHGTDLLSRLFHALHDRQWSIGPGARVNGAADVPTMRATDGTLTIEAVAGPAATVVTLTGPSLKVGVDPDPALFDDVRDGVA